ncbi:DUF1127 domain-containing protein [Acuticoccus yangtzensis]|nr:DUF1127 domain-containing protein [Acuticoccus yangtzensis]
MRSVRLAALWLDIWTERRHLEQLDDHMLRDIGVSAAEARAEAGRAAWDVPPQRLTIGSGW